MNVWLYYAKTGGGHKAPAEALASEFRKSYPEERVTLVDLAEKAEIFFRYLLEDGYIILIDRLPLLYALLYTVNSWRPMVMIENKIIDYFVTPSIKAKLVSDRPDGIIATHFFISPLLKALKQLKISVPITVIVTEPFSAPSPWFFFPKINYIVFSEEAKAVALKEGVSESNVAIFKPIINHAVASLNEKSAALIKKQYGLTSGKKIILVIGGAYGLPRGVRFMSALLKESIEADLVVVCGNNKNFEKQMRTLSGQYPNRMVVLGFVKEIAELISVTDLVISKAGAGVVFETLLNRKPLLITHYIYGQERGTMEFVVKNNFGWYEPRPSYIAQKVRDCLRQDELDRIALAHRLMRLDAGNGEITDYLRQIFYKQRVRSPEPSVQAEGRRA